MDNKLITRHAQSLVEEALLDTRIVVIQGARQVGKSTLAKQVLANRPGLFVSLDDEDTRLAAELSPASFVEQASDQGTLCIDEIQRVPQLILALKKSVDANTRPGRFLLTGSANLLQLPATQDSLAGRAENVDLYGLSQGELLGVRETFLDRTLAGEIPLGWSSELTRDDYMTIICAGGYPSVLERQSGRRRARWLDNYVSRIVRRDAEDVSSLQRLSQLPILLRLLAARNTKEQNLTRLAEECDIPVRTLPPYIDLLETLYLIHRIPAWFGNLAKRPVKRSRTALFDTGFAAQLINTSSAALDPLYTPTVAGDLLEAFVMSELRKHMTWSENVVQMYHFRDRAGAEVDIVLEANDGRVIGIEIKAGPSFKRDSVKWLEMLRDKLGRRFVAGIVFYTGQQALPAGEKISILPLAALWK